MITVTNQNPDSKLVSFWQKFKALCALLLDQAEWLRLNTRRLIKWIPRGTRRLPFARMHSKSKT